MKTLLLIVFGFLPVITFANEGTNKKPPTKPTPKVKAPKITIQYSGGNKTFNSLKIEMDPFALGVSFKTNNVTYIRDCSKVMVMPESYWLCKSECSGGDLKIFFEEHRGYDILKIPAFKIQPSLCDENSSPDEPWIETKSELVFQLKKLGTK